jgi:hypothetical protein
LNEPAIRFDDAPRRLIHRFAQPLITFAICRELDASVLTTKLSVVMAALPSGFFGILFGTSYRRISDEANSNSQHDFFRSHVSRDDRQREGKPAL